jgi:N-acetylmuramoyl-L-alanine amidase
MDELVHREHLSPNCDARALPVSMVVLHYTGMPSAAEAEARMCDAACKVSAHYMIGEDGEVVALVPEHKRAWHAGRGYRPFPEPQMAALLPLLARIVRDYDIPRANVVGHSDVAPARKEDPGELFDWPRLARHRLALPIPEVQLGDPFDNEGAVLLALERFGYDISDGRAAVRAFQRRWRPERIDGEIDLQIGALVFALLLDRDQGRTR